MRELSGALIATSHGIGRRVVPVSFLGGITGQLYRQFSVTIVVSVIAVHGSGLDVEPGDVRHYLASVS